MKDDIKEILNSIRNFISKHNINYDITKLNNINDISSIKNAINEINKKTSKNIYLEIVIPFSLYKIK